MKGYDFKVGDKVRCKKNYYDPKYPRVLFYENNYYIVDEKKSVSGIYIKMLTGEPEYLSFEKGQLSLDNAFHEQFHGMFQDFFYSNEEDRKIKIEKIVTNE